MDEGFWRASASGHKRSVKKKRRASTLPRGAARKRLRKAGAAARCSSGCANTRLQLALWQTDF